ncbi:orexin receptor type 2-like [Plakobranchus ocellatus]|uniref:Orexin receptor type 2-like n=1 Tax=Plakobranchus ocellatus TaxID=259542 RepID=A0AAV4A670_9GAST|nr:orexin receptor type 2-like [Plakobranchus ocellatus]
MASAEVYFTDQITGNVGPPVNKKYYNWLRDVFHDPPYILDLYKLLTERARDRSAGIGRSSQGGHGRSRLGPISPPRPTPPPTDVHPPPQSSSWIYYPRGDGNHDTGSISEWLSQSSAGGNTSPVCDNSTLLASVFQNSTSALQTLARNISGTSGCATKWLVDLAQNSSALGIADDPGVQGAGPEEAIPGDPRAWPDDYFYGGNFTFYDYDYDANGEYSIYRFSLLPGWPKSQLEQIYKIIREAQWTSNIILTVLLAIIFILGISGNLLVLAVFARSRVRQASAVFIMALAGTDLIICSAVLPGVLLKEWAVPFRYDAACKIWEWLRCTTIPLSALILVAVAVDRYVLIGRATVSKPLTNRAAKVIILLAVLASAGMAMPPSLAVGVYQRSNAGRNADTTAHDDVSLSTTQGYLTADPIKHHQAAAPTVVTLAQTGTGINLNLSTPALSFLFPGSVSSLASKPLASSTNPYSNQPLNSVSPAYSITPIFSTSFLATPLSELLSSTSPQSVVQGTSSTKHSLPSTSIYDTTTSSTSPQLETSPAEFYLGLCWQNGLLVSEATSEYYWQAIAVLFLLVLILVLVLYGLVFRAVLQQSRRWGRVSSTPSAPAEISPSSAKSLQKGAKTGDTCVKAHCPSGGENSGAILVHDETHVESHCSQAAVLKACSIWSQRIRQKNKRVQSNDAFSLFDSTCVFSKQSKTVNASTSLTKLSPALSNTDAEEITKDFSQASSNQVVNTLSADRRKVRNMEIPQTVPLSVIQDAKLISEDGEFTRRVCGKERNVKPAEGINTTRIFVCGAGTDRNRDKKNHDNQHIDDDVTSLDDGHYNNITSQGRWASSAPQLPGQIVLQATSIFCLGTCTVGRTKHYQSFSGNPDQLQTLGPQYPTNTDSEPSTVSTGTKTTCIARKGEKPYKRPGWVKRQLVKALQHTTSHHQEQRKFHQTAVIKLNRRQRAKVRMLQEEQNTWTSEDSSCTRGRSRTAWDILEAGGEDGSMCNHLDMKSAPNDKNYEEKHEIRMSPIPQNYRENFHGPGKQIVQDSQEQNEKEEVFNAGPFSYKGKELQNEINSNAKVSPEGNFSAGIFASLYDLQSDLPKISIHDGKSYKILHQFNDTEDHPELSSYCFSLPNTPQAISHVENEKRLKHTFVNASDQNTIPNCKALKSQLQNEANPAHKASYPKEEHVQQTSAVINAQEEEKSENSCDYNQLTGERPLTRELQRHHINSRTTDIMKQVEDQTLQNPSDQETQLSPSQRLNQHKDHQSLTPSDCDNTCNSQKKPAEAHSRRYITAQIKTAKVLVLVTAVYLISFAPCLLMTLDLVPPHRVIFYAYFVHSAANPLIYSFINQAFRKQLASLFKGKKHIRH